MKVIRIDNFLFTILGQPQGYTTFAECGSLLSECLKPPFCLITTGGDSYVLQRHIRYSRIFEACIRPAPNRSAVRWSFQCGD